MALPTPQQIHDDFVNGNWNETMLRAAFVCKRITEDEFNAAIADRKAAEEAAAAPAAKKSTKKSSKKSS